MALSKLIFNALRFVSNISLTICQNYKDLPMVDEKLLTKYDIPTPR
jgi:hypothetical protein